MNLRYDFLRHQASYCSATMNRLFFARSRQLELPVDWEFGELFSTLPKAKTAAEARFIGIIFS